MLLVVNILILFFIMLVFYQILLATTSFDTFIEGLENQYNDYDMNNPSNALILAQQNAGNISYIKERLDSYNDTYQQLQDLSGNYDILEKQVNDLLTAQQDYANQMTGGVAPDITGAVNEDENEEDISANDFMSE